MFKKVLCPIDVYDGKAAQACLAQVVKWVREWDAELVLMYVFPGFRMPLVASYFPDDAMRKMYDEASSALHEFIDTNVPKDLRVTPVVCEGRPYEEILREAGERGADLIVIPGKEHTTTDRVLLGSTASRVVDHAHCSVLVLRGDDFAR